MTYSELLDLIVNFQGKYPEHELSEDLIHYRKLNLSDDQITLAHSLLLQGIKIYQTTENYYLAISKFNESIIIIPSSACHFNRGTVHWCENNLLEAFKDHSATLILDKTNYPLAYFYLANSAYQLLNLIETTSIPNEIQIIDFITDILKDGQAQKEQNCVEMLPFMVEYKLNLLKG